MPLTLSGKAIETARHITTPRLDDVIGFDIVSGGATLHIHRDLGEFWIDVEIEHQEFNLAALLEVALVHGFELDDAYYDEQQPDGRLRSYLLEVEAIDTGLTE